MPRQQTFADIVCNALDKDYTFEQAATDLGDLMNERELIKRRYGPGTARPRSSSALFRYRKSSRWAAATSNANTTEMKSGFCINPFPATATLITAQNQTQPNETLQSGDERRLKETAATHGLIKKVGRCYKYYLTKFGRRVLAASLKIREYFVLPALCPNTT